MRASGMLASARLLGQTSGAALVAALFRLYEPATGCHITLGIAAALALFGSLVSFSRLSPCRCRNPPPKGLTRTPIIK